MVLRRRVLLGLAIAALLILAAVEICRRLDLERSRADPARLQRLRRVPLLSIAGPSRGSDWPQWRGPNRDGLSPEVGLLKEWPATGPRVLWQVPVGRGFSSLAVAEGRVCTMMQESSADETQEAIVCWDAETGREQWRFRYSNRYDERFGSGPRSTPAVAGGLVYAVGPTGIMHCLRGDSGKKVWRHDLLVEFGGELPRYGVSFSPLVEGELVIVTPGGRNGGAVAAFDRRTGKLVWKALDDPIGYSSPIATSAAGVRQVLVLTNKALVSLHPADGHVNFRHPWEAPGGFNIATPIAFGDYVFLSSGYGKGCTLLEISGGDGALRAGMVYEHNRMRNHFASSVRCKDHIYGFDNTDLACLEVRTGKVVWRERGRHGFRKGSLLAADGHLIVLGENGRLALAEATPEGYREKSAFQVSANKCWTMPVLAGGRLYVRDEGRLVCLALR
jgi:outer membrane protein assembly factor BamB